MGISINLGDYLSFDSSMLSPQTERVLNDLEAHSRSSHLPGHLGRSIECGQKANAEFSFGKDYRNLNHGSFGAYPTPIRSILRKYQSLFEQQPDAFVRYDYPKLLDVCRKAIAGYINAPTLNPSKNPGRIP